MILKSVFLAMFAWMLVGLNPSFAVDQHGQCPEKEAEDLQYLFQEAVEYEEIQVVAQLLDSPCVNPNQSFDTLDARFKADSPLHWATVNGGLPLFSLLLNHSRVDANLLSERRKSHVLLISVKSNDIEKVKLLLDSSKVLLSSELSGKLLNQAIHENHYDLLKILVAHPRVDVQGTFPEEEYLTAYAIAVEVAKYNGDLTSLEILNSSIRVNPNLISSTNRFRSPLEWVVTSDDYINITKKILENPRVLINAESLRKASESKQAAETLKTLMKHPKSPGLKVK